MKKAYLLLSDGTKFSGTLFGAETLGHGEVVFNTGMTGYELSLSDPSYKGQILTFTYPMIGNYGIASEEKDENGITKNFESDNIHVRGVVLGECSPEYSHHSAKKSLDEWLKEKGVPGIMGVDTRALTQKLREHGVMLGQVVPEREIKMTEVPDPNEGNLVAEVSCDEIRILEPKEHNGITIAAIDTGIKNNILRSFLNRGVRVIQCPWDTDISTLEHDFDALFLSNGPGDPEAVAETIGKNIHYAREQEMPVFGICLGNQILSLTMGAKTFKMKYGHRGVNQPCMDEQTKKAVITSQNHGFAVDDTSLPAEMEVWFSNLNDGTIEGVRHISEPVFSVQFHPEACAGPEDTNYLFDDFIEEIKKLK